MKNRSAILASLYMLVCMTAPVSAAVLTGSGANLIIPATGSIAPGDGATISPVSGLGPWTGSWSSPPSPAYGGSFSGTGNYPCCGNSGVSTWSFAGLGGGFLPAGTFFRLGDLDNGETMSFRAFDQSNNLITTAWLDEAIFASSANPGDFNALNYPGWSFAAGVYSFTGRAGQNAIRC